MALTERQKAENKAAKLVRDRAYAARKRAHAKDMDSLDQDPAVLQARLAADEAHNQTSALVRQRDEKAQVLKAEIAALEARIDTLLDESAPGIDAARERASNCSDAWRQAKRKAQDAVEARYPDLQGGTRWSVGNWQIPHDVQAEMDAARAAASAQALAPSSRKKRA